MRRLAPYAFLLLLLTSAAHADNPMGYRLLQEDEVSRLQSKHGALGVEVEAGPQINDSGMTFELIRIKSIHSGTAAAHAGLKKGDLLIALDGRVFPSLKVFAAYVGSISPGSEVMIDTIPANAGPSNAQRLSVVIGGPAQPGMSTGTKIAIGAGAAALLGCYEMGCFSKHEADPSQPR